jgi:acyl-CoA synthetase (AMP-forming)/AMP-acid ligase II
MLLHEILKNSAHRYPHKTAVVFQKERPTFSDIDRLSDKFSEYLLENSLRPGERVALFLENSVDYIVSYFGVLKAGGVIVPLNTQMVFRELNYLIGDCSPRFIITDSAHQARLKNLIDPRYLIQTGDVLQNMDCHLGPSMNLKHHSCQNVKPGDVAMIIYTSGTSGRPKGVTLSHKNLVSNAKSIIEYLSLTPNDSVMVILPFYYSYGNSLLTTHIKAGATLVIDNRFIFPNVVLELMEKECVTGFAGVPSHYAILLRKSALKKYKLSSLRYVTQAGGALSPGLIREFLEIVPHTKFYVMYGQTEATARLTYLNPAFISSKSGSIGKAIPGVDIAVVDENGHKVKDGEIGEIVAQGDNIMLGYWNAPEETDRVLRGGLLYTGDLARVDDEGFIYLVARKKEMIKSGANRISPYEIEEVVSGLPGVLECAAVGVPDEILGETIKVCIVKNGVSISENDVFSHCKKNLAAFKMPRIIEFRESLPKTSTGKVRRAELKDSV